MSGQSHRSDPRILGRRTLEGDHRCLAALLRPGLFVLDVGCGTGAITAGIARAVGPEGRVVGVDRDDALLQLARAEHAAIPNLRFESGDATSLAFRAEFDIVTAARTLQWIADPALAVARMKEAARRSGLLVVLDYNHQDNRWAPEPPAPFQRFYDAFLAWRQANRWDNRMADHLPDLFRSAGLIDVTSEVQDEAAPTTLWSEVIENVGPQLGAAGFCTEPELREARESYDSWVKSAAVQLTLAMRAVTGVVPVLP